jgi:hypothetical protein
MKKLLISLCLISSFFAAFAQPQYVSADAICYQVAAPTPIPTTGKINLGICDSTGHLLVTSSGGATPIPYPTNTAGVLLVQPTNVPTIGVTVVNTPGVICISGCTGATPIAYPTTASGILLVAPTALPTLSVTCVNCATPIPFPTLGVNVLNTPTVNAGTGFPTPLALQPVSLPTSFQTAFPTPIPFPTLGVTVINTPTVNQGTSPWVVTTSPPFSGSVTQGTSPWVVNTPAPYATAGGSLLFANTGGAVKTILTAASATACTNLEVSTVGILAEIINTGAAQTVFLTMYDEGTTPTCAAGDLIYGDGTTLTLGAGQIITFGVPLSAGLSYKLSGALTANVVITYR